jgi:subtilisin family serine protease
MKYLVLRNEDNLFTTKVSGGRRFPSKAEAHDLNERQVDDLRRDPRIHDVIPSIPLTLVEPFREQTDEKPSGEAWGVQAVGATDSQEDGANVTVAILDTGIDQSHPALKEIAFADDDLMDFTTDEKGQRTPPQDIDGHGTHVAGTIFGRKVDGIRIGVAPGVKRALIGKVVGKQGGSTAAVYNGIQWAVSRGADVISMSLGINLLKVIDYLVQEEGLPRDIATSRALEGYRSNVRLFDRVASLVDARQSTGQGALLVAASGNESRRKEDLRFTVSVSPPANADGIIAVGAVSESGEVADFSNTGCFFNAPGVSILSCRAGGGLVTMSGTSMAAPHVAGVIALWVQRLFPGGERPEGWAKDVLREVESHAKSAPREQRRDLGIGSVRAPPPKTEDRKRTGP